MKKCLILFVLILCINTALAGRSCEDVFGHELKEMYAWGEEVDVAYQRDITFYVKVNKSLRYENLCLEVDNFAGFECPKEDIVMKFRSNDCLTIKIAWEPGADYSGCELKLYDGTKILGKSMLYMNY